MIERRSFLRRALCAAGTRVISPLTRGFGQTAPRTAILDAHVHLFDPGRPGGIPWPDPDDAIYRVTLPDRLRAQAAPLGVVGAIAVEASPLHSDNDWLLGVVMRSPFMVGMIGDLAPAATDFQADLERLGRSPLFLGIRYGNLWGNDFAKEHRTPEFVRGLRALARAGLTFETANPDPALLDGVRAIAQRVPELRIVIDHLPHASRPAGAVAQRAFQSTLAELAQAPHVFVKLSEVLAPRPGEGQSTSEPYLAVLEPLWEMFGATRLLFGSDWPNSDHVATYAETLSVAEDFLRRRAPAAMADVLFNTSRRAYRWRARVPEQSLAETSATQGRCGVFQ